MDDAVRVVVGLRPACGAVDDLVGDDQGAGADLGAQGADRAGGEDLADAEGTQGPQVRPVGDPVRGEAVVAAVAGHEGDRAPSDPADGDDVAGRAVRRGDLDLCGVVEQGVKPRTADDSDVRASDHGAEVSATAGP
ncbi:hypothetical protein GCM10018952_08900 [Streptosporangium vulgare]